MLYKAFISYSHAADGKLAPALQSALHRFAKPWWRLRSMRVFRDRTNLAANPHLWPSIERALGESEYLLLFASPQSAGSRWVEREVTWWLTQSPHEQPLERLLILLTHGELVWDPRGATTTGRGPPPSPPDCAGSSPKSRCTSTFAGPAAAISSPCGTAGFAVLCWTSRPRCSAATRTGSMARTSANTGATSPGPPGPQRRWR
jgi:hypothetical protein